MEIGNLCRLDVSQTTARSSKADPTAVSVTVTGVIVGCRPHVEEADRLLYYFRTTNIEHAASVHDSARRRRAAVIQESHSSGECRRNTLSVSSTGQSLVSSEGYVYSFDGWYDAMDLYSVARERAEIPDAWLEAMERSPAVCEMRYLCYAFRPWFDTPFGSLQYLPLPEKDVCYSVSLCHRCLSPFFTVQHLQAHLEGYCPMAEPPGTLIYDDPRAGRRVYYVDGAQHLHYARCLCLLGKCFIESKLLENDVDIYEFFVVTIPRAALPVVRGSCSVSTEHFRSCAARYDAERWTGQVVVGYFSRLKHRPHHALSCVLTMPMFQRMRLGNFMLDVAYFLTSCRQTICGCAAHCGMSGGAISRPFSPHGQVLLLSYWRAALRRSLWQRQSKGIANEFSSADTLREALDVPIALKDLLFLLLQDDVAFYASHPDPTVSLVFQLEEAQALNSGPDAQFKRSYMLRTNGELVYGLSCFHYLIERFR